MRSSAVNCSRGVSSVVMIASRGESHPCLSASFTPPIEQGPCPRQRLLGDMGRNFFYSSLLRKMPTGDNPVGNPPRRWAVPHTRDANRTRWPVLFSSDQAPVGRPAHPSRPPPPPRPGASRPERSFARPGCGRRRTGDAAGECVAGRLGQKEGGALTDLLSVDIGAVAAAQIADRRARPRAAIRQCRRETSQCRGSLGRRTSQAFDRPTSIRAGAEKANGSPFSRSVNGVESDDVRHGRPLIGCIGVYGLRLSRAGRTAARLDSKFSVASGSLDGQQRKRDPDAARARGRRCGPRSAGGRAGPGAGKCDSTSHAGDLRRCSRPRGPQIVACFSRPAHGSGVKRTRRAHPFRTGAARLSSR